MGPGPDPTPQSGVLLRGIFMHWEWLIGVSKLWQLVYVFSVPLYLMPACLLHALYRVWASVMVSVCSRRCSCADSDIWQEQREDDVSYRSRSATAWRRRRSRVSDEQQQQQRPSIHVPGRCTQGTTRVSTTWLQLWQFCTQGTTHVSTTWQFVIDWVKVLALLDTK